MTTLALLRRLGRLAPDLPSGASYLGRHVHGTAPYRLGRRLPSRRPALLRPSRPRPGPRGAFLRCHRLGRRAVCLHRTRSTLLHHPACPRTSYLSRPSQTRPHLLPTTRRSRTLHHLPSRHKNPPSVPNGTSASVPFGTPDLTCSLRPPYHTPRVGESGTLVRLELELWTQETTSRTQMGLLPAARDPTLPQRTPTRLRLHPGNRRSSAHTSHARLPRSPK